MAIPGVLLQAREILERSGINVSGRFVRQGASIHLMISKRAPCQERPLVAEQPLDLEIVPDERARAAAPRAKDVAAPRGGERVPACGQVEATQRVLRDVGRGDEPSSLPSRHRVLAAELVLSMNLLRIALLMSVAICI